MKTIISGSKKRSSIVLCDLKCTMYNLIGYISHNENSISNLKNTVQASLA